MFWFSVTGFEIALLVVKPGNRSLCDQLPKLNFASLVKFW